MRLLTSFLLQLTIILASTAVKTTSCSGGTNFEDANPEHAVSSEEETGCTLQKLCTFASIAAFLTLPNHFDKNRVQLLKQRIEESIASHVYPNDRWLGILLDASRADKSGWLPSIIKLHHPFGPHQAPTDLADPFDMKDLWLIRVMMLAFRVRLCGPRPETVLLPIITQDMADELLLLFEEEQSGQAGLVSSSFAAIILVDGFIGRADPAGLMDFLESLRYELLPDALSHLRDRLIDLTTLPGLVKYVLEVAQPSQETIIKASLACNNDQSLQLLLTRIVDNQAFQAVAFKKVKEGFLARSPSRLSSIIGIKSSGFVRFRPTASQREELVALLPNNDLDPFKATF